jgi:hypothetical protein
MTAWQVLARDESGIAVLRCPEGHIHLEIDSGVVTVRFSDKQFIAFARTIVQAARTVTNGGLLWPFEMPPLGRFSRN